MSNPARFVLVAVALLVAAPDSAFAQSPSDNIEIRIERMERNVATAVELGVDHEVTVIDKATGQPSETSYEVYSMAIDAQGAETEAYACQERRINDPKFPPGLYYCPLYVDRGGTYTFKAIVNVLRAQPDEVPQTLASATAPFTLETTQEYTGGDDRERIKGDFGAVAVLWLHVLVAGAWFPVVLALAALALPTLRRRLSSVFINRLEWRLDLITKLTMAGTAAVVGTGTYLLFNETPYETPLSPSEIEARWILPYARPYFLSFFLKLAVYALMIVAVIPLVREARRQSRLGVGMTAAPEAPGPWGATGTSTATVTQAPAPPAVQHRAALITRVGVAVLTAGLLVISLCVTLMKYFHQLIEQT